MCGDHNISNGAYNNIAWRTNGNLMDGRRVIGQNKCLKL